MGSCLCGAQRTCGDRDPEIEPVKKYEYNKDLIDVENRINRLENELNWLNIKYQEILRDNHLPTKEEKNISSSI